MHSWSLSEGKLSKRPIETKEKLDEGYVAIRLEFAALSGSDLDTIVHNPSLVPGKAGIGTVFACGDNADHFLGKRVLVGPSTPCGECNFCRSGHVATCAQGRCLGEDVHGAFASEVIAHHRWLTPLEGILSVNDSRVAYLGNEGGLAYTAFANAGVHPGQDVFIIGDNGIAKILVEVSKAKGAKPRVLTKDGSPVEAPTWFADRQVAVAPYGAHAVCDSPTIIFETTAQPEGRMAAIAANTSGSTTIWIGHSKADAPVDLGKLITNGGTLICVPGPHPDLLPELVALYLKRELSLDFVEEITLSDLAEKVSSHKQGSSLVVDLLH